MSNAEILARIDELETRVAFQEHALNTLSDELASARLEIDRYERLLRRVLEELQAARGSGVTPHAADEPPPPHY